MTVTLKIAARVALFLAGASAPFAACTAAPRPAASQAQASETKRFDLKGSVVAIDKTGKRVTVDHEAVPGFMGAMTMSYPVRDEKELDGLKPGDRITATVVSTQGMYWLEDVKASR